MNQFWPAFLNRHRIPYEEKRNDLYIDCPLCGKPGKKLGVSKATQMWGCWRDPAHRGRSAVYLVQRLLGCTKEQAEEEVKGLAFVPGTVGALADALAKLDEKPKRAPRLQPMRLPPGFDPILPGKIGPAQDALSYLARKRGFGDEAPDVAKEYRLMTGAGEFSGRLIIPFYIQGRLVGWTGRAIGRSRLRYDTRPMGKGIGSIIGNHDHAAKGGRLLVIVEGPLDCLKVDWYGKEIGVRSIPLFGLLWNEERAALVRRLMRIGRFKRLGIMLDSEATGRALILQSQMPDLAPQVIRTPDAFKDPGDMGRRDIHRVLKKALRVKLD